MKCKCGATARITECGFTTTTKIWWCDICKDEVTEIHFPNLPLSDSYIDTIKKEYDEAFPMLGQFNKKPIVNGGYNETDKKEYFRIRKKPVSQRTPSEKEWIQNLSFNAWKQYRTEWHRHGSRTA